MTTEIEATYRVVTPSFCAGADQARPEVRGPSFKGVLRFWCPALAWSRLKGDLTKIRQEEDSLFGYCRAMLRAPDRLGAALNKALVRLLDAPTTTPPETRQG